MTLQRKKWYLVKQINIDMFTIILGLEARRLSQKNFAMHYNM